MHQLFISPVEINCNYELEEGRITEIRLVPGWRGKKTKVFIWGKVGSPRRPTFKAINPPPRVTLPLSQLCDFSCKRFAAIYI